jgi:capsule polysaccharide export protein KpsE/RkpR
MKKTSNEQSPAAGKIPKAEAIARITGALVEIRAQLTAARAELAAGASPGKQVLNFKVNALRKRANAGKTQIARLKRDPRAEVLWSDKFGA